MRGSREKFGRRKENTPTAIGEKREEGEESRKPKQNPNNPVDRMYLCISVCKAGRGEVLPLFGGIYVN